MKLSTNKLTLLLIMLVFVLFSCKKEDDNISDTNQDGTENNQEELIFGCLVDTACNYNALANQDSESCNYDCYGCTESTAYNYQSDATIDDGSCQYAGCTESTAYNYQSDATIDDGSCQYANQIIVNTWSVSSECDGLILGNIIPEEITIESGQNEGQIITDFGLFTLSGTINQDGVINIPSQDVSFSDFSEFSLVTISGTGQLTDEQNAIINIAASIELLNTISESCTLSFSL